MMAKEEGSNEEVAAAAEALLLGIDRVGAAEVVVLLEGFLERCERLDQVPVLVDVVERMADIIVANAPQLLTTQLITALMALAEAGIPYYLLFEVVLQTVLERRHSQGLSWSQAVWVLESFARVRLRIDDLQELHSHLLQPHELARMPTMALIRFFNASARLDLMDGSTLEVNQLMDRILAETTPLKPLPLNSSVLLVQCLLFSGVTLPDRQLRHLLAWMAGTKLQELSIQQLTVLRQYTLFVLAQPDEGARQSLLRLPVEIQRFLASVLNHRAPAWAQTPSDTTRQFRDAAYDALSDSSNPGDSTVAPPPVLGPAGAVDMQVGEQCWLLDGPEAFYRPFVGVTSPRYTPQEIRRRWLLERLLTSEVARQAVADFYKPATAFPTATKLQRLSWVEWARTPSLAARRQLFE